MRFLMLLAVLIDPQDLPPAQEVIERVVERTNADRKILEAQDIEYVKTYLKYDVREEPKKLVEWKRWRMWYKDGHSLERLVAENGDVRNGEPQSPGPDAFRNLPHMYRFAWATDPIRLMDGRMTYVITFSPLETLPETETKAEIVLVRMAGVIFIDAENFFIRELRAELPESFRERMIFNVKEVTATFSQRMYQNIVVFDAITINADYTVTWVLWPKRTHEFYEYRYSSYGPRDSK